MDKRDPNSNDQSEQSKISFAIFNFNVRRYWLVQMHKERKIS